MAPPQKKTTLFSRVRLALQKRRIRAQRIRRVKSNLASGGMRDAFLEAQKQHLVFSTSLNQHGARISQRTGFDRITMEKNQLAASFRTLPTNELEEFVRIAKQHNKIGMFLHSKAAMANKYRVKLPTIRWTDADKFNPEKPQPAIRHQNRLPVIDPNAVYSSTLLDFARQELARRRENANARP